MHYNDANAEWIKYFTERERKQIEFSQEYAARFGHGAQGHNDMLIIAKMSLLLNANPIDSLPPQPAVGGGAGGRE